jgi:predicted Zn-dependent protease with MMP-like domain
MNDVSRDQNMDWDEAAYAAVKDRAFGTNLDPVTLLATDYLNHFNEIVMLLEMVPDMPEILQDAQEWQPKTYTAHFETSTIADKDLAIEAYPHVPSEFKVPFEETVQLIDIFRG